MLMPLALRVISRIRRLNRSRTFGAIVRLTSGPAVKLNPRTYHGAQLRHFRQPWARDLPPSPACSAGSTVNAALRAKSVCGCAPARGAGGARSRADRRRNPLVWRACESVDAPLAPGGPRAFGPLLKVWLLTGQRRNEVGGMTRDELSDVAPLPENVVSLPRKRRRK
jgi:hypothetical protein